MQRSPIYLDHNATTPMHSEVAAAMLECYQSGYRNPASQHRLGQQARRVLEDARDRIATILGADGSDRLVLTSGGTEANNLAIRGGTLGCRGNVVISSLEHPCVSGAAEIATGRDLELRRLPATRDGSIRRDAGESSIDQDTILVSVMLANHETGVVQPVAEIASQCRKTDAIFHTDAAQAVGRLPVNFRQLRADTLTVSAHKFGGPGGVGALLVRHGVRIQPIMHGGFQQLGLRPGTESVALAVGMKVALEQATRDLEARRNYLRQLRDGFERHLLLGLDNLVIQGVASDRLPQTSCVSFLGVDRQALMMALDMAGIACSTGSACASGSSEPSPVLQAMDCPAGEIASAIRFSFGVENRSPEIEPVANRIINVVKNLRR